MLRIGAFQPYNQILYMLILFMQVIRFPMPSKPSFSAFKNFKQIENPLNMTDVMSQNVLAVSTLSIQAKSPNCHQMLCILTLLIQSNYNVNSNTKSSNYMKLQINALNYNKIRHD